MMSDNTCPTCHGEATPEGRRWLMYNTVPDYRGPGHEVWYVEGRRVRNSLDTPCPDPCHDTPSEGDTSYTTPGPSGLVDAAHFPINPDGTPEDTPAEDGRMSDGELGDYCPYPDWNCDGMYSGMKCKDGRDPEECQQTRTPKAGRLLNALVAERAELTRLQDEVERLRGERDAAIEVTEAWEAWERKEDDPSRNHSACMNALHRAQHLTKAWREAVSNGG